ncbi:atherin [Silurus asotus]|uniref:Atherin n=1 Tax=Silurus asotus TaxID=30991 RepID=A0AAD5FPK9_SILAS|nr:atherin [Silurus asotus]
MSEPRYREWILETIDSLRSRKARPDLERICRMVRRRHGSDPDRTRAELEKLIQEQTVLKVNYKGSVSYRNAAKVQRKCRRKVEPGAGSTRRDDAASDDDKISSSGARGPAEREEPSGSSSSCSDKEKREEEEEEEEEAGGEEEEAGEDAVSEGISSFTSCDGRKNSSGDTTSPATAGRVEGGGGGGGEGGEETHSAVHHASIDLHEPDPQPDRRTCTSARNNKQHAPRLGVAQTAVGALEDLGDRLVAAVRSLSERNGRAHAPLGLKEILGFLGTQAAHATNGEKLTRHRVKVVLEREIEKGRLRRTRLGHIAVPARRSGGSAGGSTGASTGADQASERLPASTDRAPQDGRVSKQSVIWDAAQSPAISDTAAVARHRAIVRAEDGLIARTGGGTRCFFCTLRVEINECVLCTQEKLKEEEPMEVESVQDGSVGEEAEPPTQLEPQSIKPEGESDAKVQPQSPADSVFKAEVGVSSCLLTPSASPGAAEERGMNGGVFVKTESSITNPVDWTVADVASYFTAAGFPEQALAFRMQEIDGKSLLLMQRNDVLTGLSIRLGPALKIYERHVKVLQRTHFQDDEAFC